jgi:hypothetical protein
MTLAAAEHGNYGRGSGCPRANPIPADSKKCMSATKNIIFAISAELIATPSKPRRPAMSAMMRNVTAQPSMMEPSQAI